MKRGEALLGSPRVLRGDFRILVTLGGGTREKSSLTKKQAEKSLSVKEDQSPDRDLTL